MVINMNKFKKIGALGLAAVLGLGALSGCGAKQQTSTGDGAVEMDIFMHFYGYCVFDDDWDVFKVAAEKTGVTLHGTAVETVSDSAQAFSTMLAEKKLPDIICYMGNELKKNGERGALVPLEDLISEYAPNIQKFFEECPEAKVAATASDGHIYYIPGTLAPVDMKNLPSMGFFIRQDWLDKLGLSVPKTVDEYHDVLKAFREKDPNGNGKKDEIPYFDRKGALEELFQLFAAHGKEYVKDGVYKLGFLEEEYKNAIQEIAKWYSEDIIDKEIFTRGNQAREQLLSSNLGGSTHDWFSSTASYNEKYPENGMNFVPIAPPADINGVVKEDMARSLLHGLGWGISKDNKDPIRTIKYFNWWLSDEATQLHSYGIEGVHYNVVNGEKVFTEEVLKGEGGVPNYLRNIGALVEFGAINDIGAELAGMNELARKGFNMYLDNNYIQPSAPALSYNREEQKVIDAYENNIKTFVSEQQQKWILGTEDVDATWDRYIETLKSMNVDEYLKALQSAYVRYTEELRQ